MKHRLSALAGAASLAVATFFAAAPPAAEANHSWGNYHWARTSNPFTLKIGDNVTGTWDGYLTTAIADWSASGVLDLTEVAGSANPKTCRPTAGRVEVCNASYGRTGWLGLAQIWISGGHITQGTAKMNDWYGMREAEKQYVMCQEVGHTFGLAHQDENFDNPNLGSCMDYSRFPEGGGTNGSTTNLHSNKHDFDQLVTIYTGHTDSTTTVGQSTNGARGGAQGDGNAEGEWGRPVRFDREGTPIAYERDLGNNQRLLTWVIRERGHGQGSQGRP